MGQKPPRQALAAAAVLPVHPRLVPAGRLGLATLPASEARAADEAEAGVGVHGPPLRPALRRRVEGHGPPRLGVPGVQPGRRELHLHELLAESYPLAGDAPVPAQAHLAARAGVLRGPRPGVRRAALLLVPAADAREPARRRPLHEGRLMRRFPRLVSRRSTGPNEQPV